MLGSSVRTICLLLLTGCPAIWERPFDPTDVDTDVDTDRVPMFDVEPFVTIDDVEFIRGFARVRFSMGDPQGIETVRGLTVNGSPDVERLELKVTDSRMVVELPWLALCESIDGRIELEVVDVDGHTGRDVMEVERPHWDIDGAPNPVGSIPFSACCLVGPGESDCFSLSTGRAFDMDVVADGRVTAQLGGDVIAERIGTGRLEIRPPMPGIVQVCVQTMLGDRPGWAVEAR